MTTATDPATRIERLERKLAKRKRKVAKTQAKLKDARKEAKHPRDSRAAGSRGKTRQN